MNGDLDAKIAQLEDDLTALKRARDILHGVSGGSPHPQPAPPSRSPAGASRGPKAEALKRRSLIAVTIETHGPLTPRDLSEKCGIPLGSMSGLILHPWFEKVQEPGMNMRIKVSEVGRARASSTPLNG